jgi:hypothetical protein
MWEAGTPFKSRLREYLDGWDGSRSHVWRSYYYDPGYKDFRGNAVGRVLALPSGYKSNRIS